MVDFRIRTFGRIKSRKLSDNKNNILENILPKYEIKIKDDDVLNFPNNDGKKNMLEIGFGYGEQILNQSLLHPECNLIGCEPYLNGIISLLNKIEENNVENIKIFRDDARILIEKIPDNSLDTVFILFPDPWPKKRQNKRRIINDEFLKMLQKKISNNGTLFFASDIFDYIEWTFNFAKDIFIPEFTTFEECKKEPEWWVKTRYQQKAIKNGRECYFLKFKNSK